MANEDEKDLNFKVSLGFHKAFKIAAAENELSMKDLLEDAFWLWLDREGSIKLRRKIRAAILTSQRK